jgi:transcriptional regulator with XRE-family HTH domain
LEAKEFGGFLKELRKKRKLTIRQLDTYSGVSHSYISQIERGERGVPKPEILKKLSKPLGVEYEELMEKAGYLTKEEIVKTAITDGYFDSLKVYETNDEVLKNAIKRLLEDPNKLFQEVGPEVTSGFVNELLSNKEYENFWDEMILIALAKKGMDNEKTKEVIEELENLSNNEIEDVIDYIRYKQSKKEK